MQITRGMLRKIGKSTVRCSKANPSGASGENTDLSKKRVCKTKLIGKQVACENVPIMQAKGVA